MTQILLLLTFPVVLLQVRLNAGEVYGEALHNIVGVNRVACTKT